MNPCFDLIARPYRWLEYVSFGRALVGCRNHFLPQLSGCKHALVFGDGDGRFLAKLMAANKQLRADAVDLSPAMLRSLEARIAAAHPTASCRLCTHLTDAREFAPTSTYDLVITHFFVDCLTQGELDRLALRIAPHLTPGVLWVVSDFRIPTGRLRLPGMALVRLLYFGFRVLTGLRTTHLPNHASALHAAGLVCVAQHLSLAGMLTTELWAQQPTLTSGQHSRRPDRRAAVLS
jgi:cyclopropane fatty-acyl-phospholipid synthase-like methyltransferase